MKKILLILLFTLTLFANSDSCKLDVYYGNGVWNNERKAKISRDALKRFMRINNRTRFPVADDGETYEFLYAHNKPHGRIDDLLETYWQLYESGQISQGYFTFMTNELNAVDGLISTYTQRINNIITTYNLDIAIMIENYRKDSLNLKHNVLLVAHSQGNLFGNQMYDLLTAEEKKKFKMVSVATPANNVTGNYDLSAPYTTIKLDYAMIGIKNNFPGNADGLGHTFVDSYLMSGTLATRVKINSDIINAVNLLDQNSCPQYKQFRWISYMCPSRQSTELEVDIYGSKIINDNGMTKEELVASDVRVRVFEYPVQTVSSTTGSNGSGSIVIAGTTGTCPLTDWDYITGASNYNKNGCSAYTFDNTAGNYHSLDYIAAQTYDNDYTCTQYNMNPDVTDKLRSLQ